MTGIDSHSTRVGETLLGRSNELELLRDFLARAAAGGDALVVLGEAGVGKTALLRAAEGMVEEVGGRFLTAAGVESEADVTFAGLHEALFPLHDRIVEIADPYREALTVALGFGDGPAPDRLRVASATLRLLIQAASTGPLLLTIDDLQWLDRSSAVVLSMVARRLRGTRVAMLGASRTSEESFFERAGLSTIELGPIDDTAAAQLLNAHFPELAPAARRRLLAEAEGNPLALLELPAALNDRQRTALASLPAVLPMPRRLHGLFQSRVASLPKRSQQLLLLVALDATGDIRLLQPDEDSAPALDDLAPAEIAGLVTIDATARRVTFPNQMIRSAVVESSTRVERREAHRRLAELWTDEPERQVWHLAEAAVHADEHVAALLEQVSERVLRRGDAVGAVTALIRAAGLSSSAAERARRTALAAYIGAEVAGQLHDASRLLADAQLMDPGLGSSLQAATTAALLLVNTEGDVETAHQLLAGAIASYRADDGDLSVLLAALNTLMMICHQSGRPAFWMAFDRELDKLGGRAPTVLRISARTLSDPARQALPVLTELETIVGEIGREADPSQIMRTAVASFYVDRLTDCREALNRLVRESPERGTEGLAVGALCALGFDSFLSGEWEAAAQQGRQAIELFSDLGFRRMGGTWPARYVLLLVAAGRGDHKTVRSVADEMIQWAAPRGLQAVQWYAWHGLALAALGNGDFEAAYRHASAISPAGSFPSHVYFALLVPMDLVEAAVRTGRDKEAAAHVHAMRELDVGALSSRLALLVAGSAAIADPSTAALDRFAAALALPEASRWPFERARIELAWGERLRRVRAMTEARSHLAAALDVFERLGAKPWTDRAAGELRATGQTRTRGPASNGNTLTPQEFEIAALAAGGLTNKEIGERLFLSPKTVAAHLYRAFPKLGVGSRGALRDALNSLPPDQRPKSLT
jgi:DNA-binding CsgD family transcriptional regulator